VYILKWFNANTRLNEVVVSPFQTEDLQTIGQRVKHINIIDYAQGYIDKERGRYYFRKESEVSKKSFKRSLERFQKALESNPDDKEILCNCAELITIIYGYGDAHHNKIAVGPDTAWVQDVYSYLQRALRVDSKSPRTLFQYAQFLRYWRNEMDLAEEYYLRALELNPNYMSCLREYGNMLSIIRGDLETAKKFYERAKKFTLS